MAKASKTEGAPADAAELRSLVQRFVRDFGLLDQTQTPCGQPLATSHAHALMFLLERGSPPPTQKELATALGIDKSNVTRLCQRMEADQLVQQERSPSDGRIRSLQLTAKGLKLAKEVDRASRARFGKLFDAVAASRRAHVLEGLRSLTDAIAALRDS